MLNFREEMLRQHERRLDARLRRSFLVHQARTDAEAVRVRGRRTATALVRRLRCRACA